MSLFSTDVETAHRARAARFTFFGMRMRSSYRARSLTIVALLAVGVALAGCSAAGEAGPTASATASTANELFPSEEQALAEVSDRLSEYLATSDAISHDGGRDPERIDPFLTSDQVELARSGFAVYSDDGLHSEGETTFDSLRLQSQSEQSVTVYLCMDVSGVVIRDAKGNDVTKRERSPRIPFKMTLAKTPQSEQLLISKSDIWSGQDFC